MIKMQYGKLALLVLSILTPIAPVSAVVNITYTQATSNATPLPLVIFIAILGIALLLLSFLLRMNQGADVVAVVAPFPLFVSAWQFLSIDMVSGYGVVSTTVYESHTWYTMYPETIIMFVLFGISLLNVYRIVMQIRPTKRDDDE